MIRAVAALAAAALLLTADPAAAAAAIGGRVAAGTGSPGAAAISAAAGTKATARKNAAAAGRAVAEGLAAAGSAAAAGSGATAARRKTELTLSYMAFNGYATAVVLRCHPAGGTHPKKAKACRLLTKVDGDPGRLKPAATMCTLEYAPVTAQVKGVWQGRPVDWSRKFGNRCEMNRTTRVLMAF
ncbi:SSI family serine proteinase inhibitor [Actinoplanes sp. NPDC049668]|uniref:SSI family serine proteinase inhibitor n=1 Tax=unclassified Actinoplanes TaxID=2626549 RepID=UPI0033B2AAD6